MLANGGKHVFSYCACPNNDQILLYFDFFWPEGQLVFTIFYKLIFWLTVSVSCFCVQGVKK